MSSRLDTPRFPVWRWALFTVLALWGLESRAQVGLKLELAYQHYLRYEPIVAKLSVRNYTGNTLVFGDGGVSGGRATFQIVRNSDDYELRPFQRDVNFAKDLILGPGETREVSVTMNNFYSLQKPGGYTVSARVGHSRFANDILSDSLSIEVRGGLPVWEQTIGVPNADPVAPIRSRTVSLLLFQNGKRDIYCLRVEDKQMVYGVARLGARILVAEPMCDVDAMSNIHVLLQTKSRLFTYRVYDYDCKLRQSKYYIADKTKPQLHRDPDVGRVMVVGGRAGTLGLDVFDEGDTRLKRRHLAAPPEEARGH